MEKRRLVQLSWKWALQATQGVRALRPSTNDCKCAARIALGSQILTSRQVCKYRTTNSEDSLYLQLGLQASASCRLCGSLSALQLVGVGVGTPGLSQEQACPGLISTPAKPQWDTKNLTLLSSERMLQQPSDPQS